MEYKVCKPNELYHYGVKGMKWGVRRYQNKDGTLTVTGKKRIKISDDDAKHLSERARRSRLSSSQTIAELKKLTDPSRDPEFNGTKPADKKWLELDNEIRKYSGDWYNSEGVSKGFKNAVRKYEASEGEMKLYETATKDAFRKYNDKRDEVLVSNLPKMDQMFIRKYDRVINNDNYNKAFRIAYDDPEVKKLYADYQSKSKAETTEKGKRQRQYEDELLSVVLKDLGYKDSPRARELIRDTVIWD